MDELAVFVGKQPIFDRKGNIYAYELLHRRSEENKYHSNTNPEEATIELLVNTFITIGIDEISGKTKSFINFSQKSLEEGLAGQLNPRFVVIEVLEDVELTPEIIQILRDLRKKGFTIALDDFMLNPKQISYDEAFKAVDIIKIDFLNSTPQQRRQIEAIVKQYPHLTLLAEKIETEEMYQEAVLNGYGLFQGYFFAKPEVVKGKEIPPNYIIHMQLIKEFNEEEPNINKVSEIFMRDVSLSYKLLRYINSVTFDVPNEIHSIQQAIMLMGLREAKRWLRILLLRDIGIGKGKGRERAFVDQSLTRAKICELLAKEKGIKNTDEYFLTGLFSLIHIIMNNDLATLLPQLSLSNLISKTLLGEETEITPYLQLTIALETFDLDKVREYAKEINVNEETLSKIVKEAHYWTTHFI